MQLLRLPAGAGHVKSNSVSRSAPAIKLMVKNSSEDADGEVETENPLVAMALDDEDNQITVDPAKTYDA